MVYVVSSSKGNVVVNSVKGKRICFLGLLVVLDLIYGGAGRIISFGPLTPRYVLFLSAMLFFIVDVWKKGFKTPKNLFYAPLFTFFALYLVAVINGILRGYSPEDIIFASKGYLYLFMLLPFTIFIDSKEKALQVVKLFNIGALVFAVLTICFFVLIKVEPGMFNIINRIMQKHYYGHLAIRYGLPSVFFKTSPYMAIAFINIMMRWVNLEKERNFVNVVYMIILFMGCLTTMNMGIWIALFVGIVGVGLISKGGKRIYVMLALVMIVTVMALTLGEYVWTAFANRINVNDSSYIIKSDQLKTLMSLWSENLFLGKGFGTEVVFVSEIKTRIMTKFELFWMELLVLTGLLGFLAYIFMILKTFFVGFKISKCLSQQESVQIRSLLIGLFMLCVVSSVNPFLNNPIGMGYLIISMSSINAFRTSRARGKIWLSNPNNAIQYQNGAS
jgi:hypothetical protein